MSVCNCVISVKKCFLSPNNGFLRFCQGKTQIPIKNYILNSTNRITTVLCQKCLTQQAHIIRASTLHPSSTILLLLSYIFLYRRFLKITFSSFLHKFLRAGASQASQQAWQAGQAGKPAQGLASWLFGITMLRHGLPDYHQITRLLYYSWWQAQQAL